MDYLPQSAVSSLNSFRASLQHSLMWLIVSYLFLHNLHEVGGSLYGVMAKLLECFFDEKIYNGQQLLA